jgi:hypothetical protein
VHTILLSAGTDYSVYLRPPFWARSIYR